MKPRVTIAAMAKGLSLIGLLLRPSGMAVELDFKISA